MTQQLGWASGGAPPAPADASLRWSAPGEWCRARRGRRESTARTAGARGGGCEPRCWRPGGQAWRRVLFQWGFFLHQFSGSALGDPGFLSPGLSAAASAQVLGSRVFKPPHGGHRPPAALLNSSGLRVMAPRAAPGSTAVRPTTHVGCL